MTDLVETDIVRSSDGLIVAHDGLEEKYGISGRFCDTSTDEFMSRKFDGHLTPLDAEELIALSADREVKLILDIKDISSAYSTVIDDVAKLCQRYDAFSKVIPQVYCYEDYLHALKYPFYGAMIAMWKYFNKDFFSNDAIAALDAIFERDTQFPIGISLAYRNDHSGLINVEQPHVLSYLAYGVKVFVHGYPKDEAESLLRRNFGLFSHDLNLKQRPSIPEYFRWEEYLELNPDLGRAGIATEHDARLHWLNFGYKERRHYRFTCPVDFDWQHYLSLHPDLQKAGLNTEEQLRAHYTKYGSNRRYK